MHPKLSHTNHQGATAYIRATPTAKGGTRYYPQSGGFVGRNAERV